MAEIAADVMIFDTGPVGHVSSALKQVLGH